MSRHASDDDSEARVKRAVSQAPPNTPIGLPTTRPGSPRSRPGRTGCRSGRCRAGPHPRRRRRTAARTPRHSAVGCATAGARPDSGLTGSARTRVSSPSATPATVAWIPESCTNTTPPAPTGRRSRRSAPAVVGARRRAATARWRPVTGADGNRVRENSAITRIAPKSSTTARVSRNARNAIGNCRPTTARTARAKAMSVAIGIPTQRAGRRRTPGWSTRTAPRAQPCRRSPPRPAPRPADDRRACPGRVRA